VNGKSEVRPGNREVQGNCRRGNNVNLGDGQVRDGGGSLEFWKEQRGMGKQLGKTMLELEEKSNTSETNKKGICFKPKRTKEGKGRHLSLQFIGIEAHKETRESIFRGEDERSARTNPVPAKIGGTLRQEKEREKDRGNLLGQRNRRKGAVDRGVGSGEKKRKRTLSKKKKKGPSKCPGQSAKLENGARNAGSARPETEVKEIISRTER